ncbi:MAG: Bug family tripartite tricarboxylate transporter substrate binding protein [Burkholderiales bacterium]
MAQPSAGPYPNRPLRLLVPFPPGGSADLIGRMISPLMSERLGRPVIVENRPGASGAIAAEIVTKAQPDGHTMMIAGTSTVMGLNAILIPNLPYDPKDLAPITLLVASPFILAVNTTMLPVGSIKELIALLKSKPQPTPFASGPNLSGMHLSGEYFKSLSGLPMLYVPYKGNGPAMADVSGGQVPMAFVDLGSTGPYRKSERVKILAIADKKRTAMAPDIPTGAEGGLPGWEAIGSFGLVTTIGTHQEIIQRLHAETTRILRLPDIRERILATGNEPSPMTPDEFGAFAKSEVAKWTRVIKEAGIKIEQ